MLKNLPWKKIVAIVVVIAIGVGGWFYWKSSSTSEGDLASKAVTAAKKDLVSEVAATGTIDATDSVDIGSKISGRILKVYIEENSYVKEGDILMQLDDEQIQSQVKQTQATLNNAYSSYLRQKSLYDQGAIAAQTLDDSEKTYLVARANHQSALSQLDDTIIRAPMSGYVIGKPLTEGSMVSAGTANVMVLATLANLDRMEIETLVDESDIGQVKEGMVADFQVDTFADRNFTGKVMKISKKSTTSNNAIYYKVLVIADQPEGLLPGMTARVTIQTGSKDGVLALPVRYVQEKNGNKVVLVLGEKNQTEERTVTTGFSTDEYVEIVSGLAEGEKVVSPSAMKQNANARIPRM